MNIIDSHCHCHYLPGNWIKENPLTNGPYNLKFLLNIGTGGDDSKQWIINNFDHHHGPIYHHNNQVYLGYSVGYHPQENITVDMATVMDMASGAMAIGEIGFDVGPHSPSMDLQIKNFHTQMTVAVELGIPALIHCRDAWDIFFQETQKYRHHPLIIHCFTGNGVTAENLINNYNCLISISGIITYKKADEIRESLAHIPIDRIISETDAPFLTPYNYRKQGYKENNPLLMVETMETIAHLKSMAVETMIEAINNNFKRFFPSVKDLIDG
jgi:TatD DNase family protein